MRAVGGTWQGSSMGQQGAPSPAGPHCYVLISLPSLELFFCHFTCVQDDPFPSLRQRTLKAGNLSYAFTHLHNTTHYLLQSGQAIHVFFKMNTWICFNKYMSVECYTFFSENVNYMQKLYSISDM